jgi:hypothetical protein
VRPASAASSFRTLRDAAGRSILAYADDLLGSGPLQASSSDHPTYGPFTTPHPHEGIGASCETSAPGCELMTASRVPHSR